MFNKSIDWVKHLSIFGVRSTVYWHLGCKPISFKRIQERRPFPRQYYLNEMRTVRPVCLSHCELILSHDLLYS